MMMYAGSKIGLVDLAEFTKSRRIQTTPLHIAQKTNPLPPPLSSPLTEMMKTKRKWNSTSSSSQWRYRLIWCQSRTDQCHLSELNHCPALNLSSSESEFAPRILREQAVCSSKAPPALQRWRLLQQRFGGVARQTHAYQNMEYLSQDSVDVGRELLTAMASIVANIAALNRQSEDMTRLITMMERNTNSVVGIEQSIGPEYGAEPHRVVVVRSIPTEGGELPAAPSPEAVPSTSGASPEHAFIAPPTSRPKRLGRRTVGRGIGKEKGEDKKGGAVRGCGSG
uniref:uncharacterized protein isoform X2 n=1 Tax=Pristiophorus japonicus TaxID=55135 RepID=UPI00398E3CA7